MNNWNLLWYQNKREIGIKRIKRICKSIKTELDPFAIDQNEY